MRPSSNCLTPFALAASLAVASAAGCAGFRVNTSDFRPADVRAFALTGPEQSNDLDYTRCFPQVEIAVDDPAHRSQVRSALGELCAQFNDPRLAAVLTNQPPWLSAPDDTCVTVTSGDLWEHVRAAAARRFVVRRDDGASPATTNIHKEIGIAGHRIRDWLPGSDGEAWAHRARLINTLSHELVHLRVVDRRYAYVDTGGSRNDYVRMWLASYRFGDINECVYLARHSSDFGGVFRQCFDHRFNDLTLASPSRSGYQRLCTGGDPSCLDTTDSLPWACRRQMLCTSCSAP